MLFRYLLKPWVYFQDSLKKFAAIRITGALNTTLTNALFVMLNWLHTELIAKQVAKFTATKFNALSCWLIVALDHSSRLEIDPVAHLGIDYLTVEYCLGFNFEIPNRSD